MKYISIFVILLCLTITANAQSNYIKGYIITNNNDTIRGFIDFRTDKINSSVCKFKLSEEADEQMFHPDDILGYMLINEVKYYVSRTITLNNNKEKVFLEYLVQGIKDLYYYPKDLGYYFFEDENGKMISVTKEADKIVDNKYKTDNKYKGLLSYIFRDCNSVTKNIERSTFERSTMIELTKKYHQQMCAPGQECIVFENDYKKTFLKFDFAFYGGLQIMDFKFRDSEPAEFNPNKYLSPVIGGEACISSPRLMKSLSMVLDASLSKIEGKKDLFKENSDFESHYQKYQFDGLISTFGLELKYTYPEGLFRPTAEAGLCYSLFLNSSNSFYNETRLVGRLEKETKENHFLLPNSFTGYKFGVGFDYQLNKKHTLFCRIHYNKMLDTAANINVVQVRFGYSF